MVAFVVVLTASVFGGEWTPTQWRGEPAWESSSCGWTAVVSAERARLIALTPPGGGDSLLFAEFKTQFSWGGHRFWLGPQTAWEVVWPPPTDWETSPAARIETEGGVLRVVHPHTDPAYPALTRVYEWRGGVLHCMASWSDARFQGIHILQIPPDAVVRVKRRITPELPLGYVLPPIYKRDGLLTDREVSPEVARIDGDEITLRNTGVVAEKIAVQPQDIVAEIGGYRLTLKRGEMRGMSEVVPDLGMVTQVYMGIAHNHFTEIEQLTPLGGEGAVVSEVLLEPGILRTPARLQRRHPVRR